MCDFVGCTFYKNHFIVTGSFEDDGCRGGGKKDASRNNSETLESIK